MLDSCNEKGLSFLIEFDVSSSLKSKWPSIVFTMSILNLEHTQLQFRVCYIIFGFIGTLKIEYHIKYLSNGIINFQIVVTNCISKHFKVVFNTILNKTSDIKCITKVLL